MKSRPTRKYITDSLSVTITFLNAARRCFDEFNQATNEEIQEEFQPQITEIIKVIRLRLIEMVAQAVENIGKSVNDMSFNIFPHDALQEYTLNQINNYLRNELGEFNGEAEFVKELKDEESAFLINCNSLNLKYLGDKVVTSEQSTYLLTYYNKQLYQIQNDINLVSKLHKGVKNEYVKFLKRSINFLKNLELSKPTRGSKEDIVSESIDKKLTHRELALIHKYKALAGYVPNEFNGIEIQKQHGAKRKQAYYATWPENGASYKSPTLKELRTIMPLLKDFPLAQKAVSNDLDKLLNKM